MNEDSVYLLLEYCTNGPVDQYLQKHERQFRNKFLDHTYDEMLKWSMQISDAMGFLAQNNIIHVSLFVSLFKDPYTLGIYKFSVWSHDWSNYVDFQF